MRHMVPLISTDFNRFQLTKCWQRHHDVARLCADSSVIHGNSLSNTVTTECLRFQKHRVFYIFIQLYNARVSLSHIDPLLDSLGPGDFQLLIYKGTGRSKNSEKCGKMWLKMTVRRHLPAVHRLPVAESHRFWICKSHNPFTVRSAWNLRQAFQVCFQQEACCHHQRTLKCPRNSMKSGGNKTSLWRRTNKMLSASERAHFNATNIVQTFCRVSLRRISLGTNCHWEPPSFRRTFWCTCYSKIQ